MKTSGSPSRTEKGVRGVRREEAPPPEPERGVQPQGAAAPAPERGVLREPVVPRAVGMIMATTPCPADEAERILAAAAAQAGVGTGELAAAMVAESRGTPLPAHVDRALSRAARAACTRPRAPGAGPGTPLLPSRAEVERALGRFFDARVRLLASPADEAARLALEDAVFTLCVLMAEPTAHAAVIAAVQYTEG
ncbi:DUF5133 domain-containing protein [Streptomyces sp. NPDC091268]|uniref:DUF5133 domain-containing protein n=1 Tax=Streptomyces sp. NPDC091268 TaxID=3365979 RepID=UPI00382B3ED8